MIEGELIYLDVYAKWTHLLYMNEDIGRLGLPIYFKLFLSF
jgi:hypothetical protein